MQNSTFIRHGRRRNRFDHFDTPLVEMGVASPRLAINQFNLSSFFQGIPGNDGIQGKPGIPGYSVSKNREKRRRATADSSSGALCINDAKAQNECIYQEVIFF